MQGELLEFGRRAAIDITERSTEMAVAGEAEIQTKTGEVVATADQVESASQTEAELIPVQGHAFHLLEDLREIDGGAADFGGDVGQGPAARQIARQHELDAINEPLASDGGGRGVRRARSESALHQSQGKAFGLEWFGDVFAQAMTKKGDE